MSSTAPELTYFPGTWRIDTTRSELRFCIRHLGIRNQRGTVNGISGEFVIGRDLASSSVTAAIELAAVDTGFRMRDEAIRSPKLLGVEKHPTATYRSTSVELGAPGEDFVVDGELTFLGVTKPVSLRFRVSSVPTGAGGEPPVLTARAELSRADFGFRLHEGPAFLDRSLGAVVQIEIRLEGAAA